MGRNANLAPIFQCPNCRILLSSVPDGYYCSHCNTTSYFSDGIVSFSKKKDFYYGEFEKPDMLRCLSLMKENGFTAGLSKYLDNLPTEDAKHLESEVNNLKTNAFEPLLAAKKRDDSSLLVLGIEWGSTISVLSTKFSFVTAVDMTKERLKALRWRLIENGINNVTLVQGGDTDTLPFSDAQFDLVILTGMFNYIDMLPNLKSTKDQQHLYSDIYRILKPEGSLVLGIKNKFSFIRFFGQPGSNFKVHFTKKDYKTSISPFFLKILLKKIKFGVINIFVTKPSYKKINEIIPITKIAWANFNKCLPIPYYHSFIPKVLRYLLKRTGLGAFFADTYLITASKTDSVSILDDLINRFSSSSCQKWRITEIKTSHTGYLSFPLISSNKQQAFGRLPLYPFASECFSKAQNFRKDLLDSGKLPDSITRLIPRTLFNYTYHGNIVVIEEYFDGFRPEPKQKDQPWFFEAIDFIHAITKVTKNSGNDNNKVIDNLLLPYFSRIKRPRFYDLVMPIVDYVNEMLNESNLFFAFSHGDLHHNNLMIDKASRLKAVIDWDACYSQQIIGYDMMYFLGLLRLARLRKQWQWGDLLFDYEELDSFLTIKERNAAKNYFNELNFLLSYKKNWRTLQSLMWLRISRDLIDQYPIMNTNTWNEYLVLSNNKLKRLCGI